MQSGQAAVQGAAQAAQSEAGEAGGLSAAAMRWTPPEAPLAMPRQELERSSGAHREARGLARVFGRSFAA